MNQEDALKKLQAIELEILLAINELCQKEGISWFMTGGTLLGAVRHGGFIPWDDDVDIAMLREDYDRFLERAEKHLPEGYSLHTVHNTPGHGALFAKVYKDGTRFENRETRGAGCPQGVFVDVFPYDRIPDDPRLRSKVIKRSRHNQRMSYLYHTPDVNVPHRGTLGRIERVACSAGHRALQSMAKDAQVFAGRRDRIVDSLPSDSSNVCLYLGFDTRPLDVSRLLPIQSITFEGHDLPAPCDAEYCLKRMYGDWRILPAPEERHTHLPLLIDFGDGTRWEAEE